jgi:hypothetical protein
MATVSERARRHAALGDATRLAIVDALTISDRSPVELQRRPPSRPICSLTTWTCSRTSG